MSTASGIDWHRVVAYALKGRVELATDAPRTVLAGTLLTECVQ